MQVDIGILTILGGTLLPLVVGIVTKEVAHRGLKAALLALLSGAVGAIDVIISEGGVFSKETIVAAGITWVTAVSTYYGFLKPTEISHTVNTATSGFGVGKPPQTREDYVEQGLNPPPDAPLL